MEISNTQLSKLAKNFKICAKNHIRAIIFIYLLLIFVLLAFFSAKIAFYPLWHKNEEAIISEDMKIDNELLQVIVEKIGSRDKAFSEVESIEFKNPFD